MEEISLRELIEIILKGKWIIALVTAVFMLVSGVVSFFLLDPTYEAQTMLMISPVSDAASKDSDGNRFFDLVGSLSQYPQMTVDTYREQVKAPVILDYIRTEMELEGKPLSAIANKISVNALDKTNLITISVKDTDPEAAAKMANLVSGKFTEFVSETSKKQAENSAEFIKNQMEQERENLDAIMEELKVFLSQPRGPEELEREVNSKLQQLTDFKTKVTQLKIDENTIRASLEQGKKILAATPEKVITSKTIISDDFLSDIVKDGTGLSTSDIAGIKLSDEQINAIYVQAASKVNQLEIDLSEVSTRRTNIESEIAARQKEIEALQAELAEKQQKYDILKHDVELIKQTYDAYQQNYKEAMIKQSAEIGKSSVITVSKAIPPTNPVAPRKMLNVAIAAVLGMMMSVFIVFMKEYWSSSSSQSTTSSIQ
jgi:succinoglycan biosynthesis transport protein ExoP